jgi:hypothetical protein
MGFWPFGKQEETVELGSDIVTASTQDGARVRGKISVSFVEPAKQAEIDAVLAWAAAEAIALIRESATPEQVIGTEADLTSLLFARYPAKFPAARSVDLAALHIVGNPSLSSELRRATLPPNEDGTSGAALRSSSAPPAAETASKSDRPEGQASGSTHPSPSAAAQPTAATASGWPAPEAWSTPLGAPAAPRRRASSQIRSMQSLLMPAGSSPEALGEFISPMIRDGAARMLIGFLRAYDLASRSLMLDESSADLLANLVPVSDAPLGAYKASRAAELSKWETKLETGAVEELHRVCAGVTLYLVRDAMTRVAVATSLMDQVLEAAAKAAFPDESVTTPDRGSLPDGRSAAFGEEVTKKLAAHAKDADSNAVAVAFQRLLGVLEADLEVSAMMIKASAR